MKVYKLIVVAGNERFNLYFKSRQKAEEEITVLQDYFTKQGIVVVKAEIEFYSNDLVPWRPRRMQSTGREDPQVHMDKRMPNAWRNRERDALK